MKNIKLKKKQKSYILGFRAEMIAAWYLRLKGFSILEQRYKTHHGEIDLIARRFNLVLIVEVKARSTLKEAMEAVSYESQKRIEKSAFYWLSRQKNKNFLTLRFDLIAICPFSLPQQVKNFFLK